MECGHETEIRLLRTELKNLRDQIRGLRAQHRKDVRLLTEKLSKLGNVEAIQDSNSDEIKDDFKVSPIGYASTWHKTKNGTPRQGVVAEMAPGCIDISVAKTNHSGMENPQYALENLQNFSHVWVIFHFHQNSTDGRAFVKTKVAPPRLKGQKVGLFSTRTPHRPNPIGLTLAKVVKVEDCKLYLQGLDLLDATPILDIKPYIPQYDRPMEKAQTDPESIYQEVEVPSWIGDPKSKLQVQFTPRALIDLGQVLLGSLKDRKDLKRAIIDVLQEDPRSNYRREKCSDRLYYFFVDLVKVTCWFDSLGDEIEVVEVLRLTQATR